VSIARGSSKLYVTSHMDPCNNLSNIVSVCPQTAPTLHAALVRNVIKFGSAKHVAGSRGCLAFNPGSLMRSSFEPVGLLSLSLGLNVASDANC
jgi:hypothetical protein